MKKNLILLFGGRSSEHEVSMNSAKNIYKAINQDKYNVILIGVSKEGTWYWLEESIFLNLNHLKDSESQKLNKVSLISIDGAGKLLSISDQKTYHIDCVFPIIHGTNGEDGTLQGYLKMMNLPFVGCGTLSSANCMDKELMKIILTYAGIENSKFLVLHSKNDYSYAELVEKLGSPFFIKPANTGSSVGVHKIKNAVEYEHKLADAFLYDHKIIAEEFIKGRELEISVLGSNQNPKASVPGELIIKHEFYTYEAKYLDPNGAEIIIPAALTEPQITEMKSIAKKAFQVMGCDGFARIDFFLKEDGTFYINELNTLPGFTQISMYPKMWQASGLAYSDLVEELINLAFAKHLFDQKIKTDR